MAKGSMALSINERLKAVRTALKLSQRDFVKGIYTSQSFYARMEKGKMPINNRIIELIVAKWGVNREYLRDGKGEIFSETPPDVRLEQIGIIYNELNPLFRDYLMIQAKELLNFQKRQEPFKKGKKTP